jgi:hypothetical protein
MSRSITVKVQRQTLIKALEESMQKMKNKSAEYDKEIKAYRVECEKANSEVLGKIKSGKIKTDKLSVNVRDAWRDYRSTESEKKEVTITFTCLASQISYPEEPQRPDSYSTKYATEEIENAIRILKLSNDELISTSSYKSVAKYL